MLRSSAAGHSSLLSCSRTSRHEVRAKCVGLIIQGEMPASDRKRPAEPEAGFDPAAADAAASVVDAVACLLSSSKI